MNLLEQIQQKTGKKLSPLGSVQNVVLETAEFRRIRDLERRDWATQDIDVLIEVLTNELKLSKGTQTLKASQAAALHELMVYCGLFAPIRVGGGKTLISLLAAGALGAKRALLLVPAGLVAKTRKDAYDLQKHWKIRPITIESYEMLSRDKKGRILYGLDPDLILADEAHKLKNSAAGCTKKVSRFLRTKRKAGIEAGLPWPHGVAFAAMSGTITTRSLREYWHLIRWALGPNAPLPADPMEFQGWAWALDEKVQPESRWQPGALERLSPNPEGDDDLKRARSAYADRLMATPGVISTRGEIPPMSLTVRAVHVDVPQPVKDAIAGMRKDMATPCGRTFDDALSLWRHCRAMQCGFYQIWDPAPPVDWLDARKGWHQYVRETLKFSRTYDTPDHVREAVENGDLKDDGLLAEWRAIRDTFKPNSVPFYIDDTVAKYAANWLSTGDTSSKLCWTEHRYFGPKLSEMTGVPYFGEQGLDKHGNLVDNHEGPAIVSVRTCSTGRNLQYKWHQNLYLSPMSKNDWWEQSLGRTHRDGQPEDEVTADVLMVCREAYSSMVYAIREAEYTTETTKEPQKLTYCTRDMGTIESLISRRDDKLWMNELEGI